MLVVSKTKCVLGYSRLVHDRRDHLTRGCSSRRWSQGEGDSGSQIRTQEGHLAQAKQEGHQGLAQKYLGTIHLSLSSATSLVITTVVIKTKLIKTVDV